MILTVTLNAALDLTYRVPVLVPGTAHRVCAVTGRAGGKGVNVAAVLRALGHDAVVTGLAGGPTGAAIRAGLAAAGLTDALVEIAGTSRRTVTVVSEQDGGATLLNEPGPEVHAEEWAAFLDRYTELVGAADVVVLAGSLPPGLPDDSYARLVTAAADRLVLVDTGGPALLAAAAAAPAVVKPNREELTATTGIADPEPAVRALLRTGARSVVASLGRDGLLAATPAGAWRARPPEPVFGNPTGAGDAAVAAIAAGLVAGTGWPELLAEAVAVSAAAVASPVAGEYDESTYRRLRPAVRTEEIHARTDG